ncbi:hypothetical protein, partial [Mycobacterium sp.]|uniref:hypothetical protein n=1 Tax=Mycobacterium sp. TaxID=1785 RepID=UPI003C73361B
ALRMHPSPPDYYHPYLSIAYASVGAYERALAHSLSIPVALPEQFAWRALAYSGLGRDAEARTEMQRLLAHAEKRWVGSQAFHPDAAVTWLETTLLVVDPSKRRSIMEVLSVNEATRGS